MADQRVSLDKETLDKVAQQIGLTIQQIQQAILNAPSYDRRTRTALLSEVKQRLAVAVRIAGDALEGEIRRQYTVGSREVGTLLQQSGVRSNTSVGVIGAATIASLILQGRQSIEIAATNVSRNAQRVISVAARREIQAMQAAGLTRRAAEAKVTPIVRETIRQNNLFGIIDRAGRQWSLERYSKMVIDTMAMEARNTAVLNKNLEAGIDLVRISKYGSKHKICKNWEGEIVSITGDTPGFPSADQPRADGVFHPGCRHFFVPLTKSERQKYSGVMASVGPNA